MPQTTYIIIGIIIIALCITALTLYLVFTSRKRREKIDPNNDQKEFDESLERFERQSFKKCRKCGGKVQIEDNICPECGEIP